ncbi:solute carrier family 25 member 44-like [Watersipora subatra]|uniref:solute carrier family 25 member 44-like n=1 Tax=Watersipora subatra TaxID=2589382 RepID=UPI00355B9CA4
MENSSPMTDGRGIQVIELHMMDKSKYYPLALVSGTLIRTTLYPLGLVKTRLQVQNKKTFYNGTWDAFKKISRIEGVRGLYRGYWVNSLLVFPQMSYITVYEGTRQWLQDHSIESTQLKSFLSGGCASVASQTFVVPLDIISQHLMMIGSQHKPYRVPKSDAHRAIKPGHTHLNTLNIEISNSSSRLGTSYKIMKAIYTKYGLRGFYKGYFISLSVYTPHSALWWLLYDKYSGLVAKMSPDWVPRLVLQCIAAPLAGCTATIITNPLDVSRTRVQVSGTGTLFTTLAELWKYEGIKMFTKAFTARMTQSTIFSFSIILGYETIKRWSLLEEHKVNVRW